MERHWQQSLLFSKMSLTKKVSLRKGCVIWTRKVAQQIKLPLEGSSRSTLCVVAVAKQTKLKCRLSKIPRRLENLRKDALFETAFENTEVQMNYLVYKHLTCPCSKQKDRKSSRSSCKQNVVVCAIFWWVPFYEIEYLHNFAWKFLICSSILRDQIWWYHSSF